MSLPPDKPNLVEIESTSAWRRTAYLIFAGLFFVLAVVGILLPGLPTTPFLLLTSYFLIRSSPRLNQRLLNSKWFGPILSDWQHKGGVRKAVKHRTLALIAIAIPISIRVAPVVPLLKLTIGLLALIGVVVVLRLPVVDESSS